jgi:hypothetical protein
VAAAELSFSAVETNADSKPLAPRALRGRRIARIRIAIVSAIRSRAHGGYVPRDHLPRGEGLVESEYPIALCQSQPQVVVTRPPVSRGIATDASTASRRNAAAVFGLG